jgi:small subunit ribosomal protein S16
MPTKIRLQRHGKKKYAYFHLVIADSRAPRDGKFIEKIGTYNPNTNPATIDIDFDKALTWVKSGAQPTDTTKALLSYKGVLYKSHLDRGVEKGAFSQEEADKRFEEWMAAKEEKINAKKDTLTSAEEAEKKKRLDAEKEANKKKAEAIAAKNAELAGEEETTEEVAAEGDAEAEKAEEAPKAEAAAEDKKEEKAEEAPKAEATEDKKEEKSEEAPKAEAAAEDKKEEKSEDKKEEAASEEKKEEKDDDKKEA